MAETREFDAIRIARSDGADTGPGYWPAATASTTAATKKPVKETGPASEKAPRTKPQMIRLTEDDPRFFEWRIKLGILLKQELAPNPEEGHPWYVHFPRGYWLYEKSKHLWVSGYPIKSKLFKSPQEFALHLIWLLSSSNEYKDCSCVHCNVNNMPKLVSSMEDNLTITPKDSPVKADKLPVKSTSKATIQPVPSPVAKTATTATAKPKAATKTQTQPIQVIPQTAVPVPVIPPPVSQPPVAQPQPAPIQQPKQIRWGLKSSYLFRVGELVWYQHGTTWRLGIIASSDNQENHELIPIAHGLVQQPNAMKSSNDLRPFYAFSVPIATIRELKGKVYDEIPWDRLLTDDPQRRDLVALDASKLAAEKIDISYSLWGASPEDPTTKIMAFYGGFLGAERIEIGDCLRVKTASSDPAGSNDQAVLGMYHMFIRTDRPDSVLFRGNLYRLVHAGDQTVTFVPEDNLPLALRDETQWRFRQNPSMPLRWALTKEDVMLEEKSIRGRFYPLQRLMSVLKTPGWEQAVAQGRIEGQLAHLNTRMESSAGRYIGRRRTRLETFGASVPHGARIVLESHVRE